VQKILMQLYGLEKLNAVNRTRDVSPGEGKCNIDVVNRRSKIKERTSLSKSKRSVYSKLCILLGIRVNCELVATKTVL